MANCPKCGRKLRLIDWRPECPGCGVNLNYYKSNEKLLEESEMVEIKHAKFQPRVDRAKAATIGSKKAIIRLILFIIPILGLLAPIFSVTVYGHKKNYNAIDIYNVVSSIDTGKVLGNISPLIIAIVLVALPAVLSIVFAVLQLTSGTQKGLKRNIVYSCVSIALVLCSIVSMSMFTAKPLNAYVDIVQNESEFVFKNGKQSAVDNSVQKIRDLFKDDKVDLGILLRAISNGQDALDTVADRGYSAEEVEAIKKAIEEKGMPIINPDDDDPTPTIKDVRAAAEEINKAVDTYNDLAVAVKYASKITNDKGIYSEKSFESFTNKLEECQEIVDKLAKGEAIVELTVHNGAGEKDPEDVKTETEEKIKQSIKDINDASASLVDISVLASQNEKLDTALKEGTLDAGNVKATFGIGIFILLALFIAQLVYNIYLKKKGVEIKYTTCLIGGLPSDEYFKLVEQGISRPDLNRKMLFALAKLEEQAIKEEQGKEEE